MNTTVYALQALYVKLGGALTDTYPTIADGMAVGDYTTIPDMIQACTQKAGSGGSALPAVTADDNDKVLAVVNGAWDKAEAPSGNNDFKVEISTDGQTITVADGVTVADIVAAAEADKHVYAIVTVEAEGAVFGHQRFDLSTWAGTGQMVSVVFGAVQEDDGAAKPVALVGENSGGADTWTVA